MQKYSALRVPNKAATAESTGLSSDGSQSAAHQKEEDERPYPKSTGISYSEAASSQFGQGLDNSLPLPLSVSYEDAGPLPSFLSPLKASDFSSGVLQLATAPVNDQLQAASLHRAKLQDEKNAAIVEGLNFRSDVRKGLKKKRGFLREEVIEELHRSPKKEVGQVTLQKNTNYAYQHGDDVINLGSTQGLQKTLGPTPSSLSPDEIFQSGFQQGLSQGVLTGAENSFSEGFEGGFMEGFQNGLQQGLGQGVLVAATSLSSPANNPAYQQGFEAGSQVSTIKNRMLLHAYG